MIGIFRINEDNGFGPGMIFDWTQGVMLVGGQYTEVWD